MGRFGHQLGLAFQATDDLLDITSSSEKMGKRTGKDAASGKQTWPRVVGLEESRAIARAAADRAVAELSGMGSSAARLVALTHFVINREA
jgi:geranylgeranyl diphosphate synthase type II